MSPCLPAARTRVGPLDEAGWRLPVCGEVHRVADIAADCLEIVRPNSDDDIAVAFVRLAHRGGFEGLRHFPPSADNITELRLLLKEPEAPEGRRLVIVDLPADRVENVS
jgi:hypothetical protein